jgi:hypothetical protein
MKVLEPYNHRDALPMADGRLPTMTPRSRGMKATALRRLRTAAWVQGRWLDSTILNHEFLARTERCLRAGAPKGNRKLPGVVTHSHAKRH